MDLVSGAYGRTPGLVALDREVVQAARTGQALLVAHLRVDGSPDPDDVLRAPAPSVRSVTREDDLLIRYGEDVLLCSLLGLSLGDGQARFAVDLLADGSAASVAVGLAQLRPGESMDELIARAGAATSEARTPVGDRTH